MLFVPLLVLGVIALGPQVVLGSFKFKLSQVVQCKPVTLTFSGSDANNHSVPTTLTILPLSDNAAPIQIPIPNGASNSTGIELTFIPLLAEQQFIASLDDIHGPRARVSDVTRVVLDPTAEPAVSNCVSSAVPATVNFYSLTSGLRQCETFTVSYSTPLPPNVTAFFPRDRAFQLPLVAADNGTARYTMNGLRQAEVVLLFDDGKSNLQTTKLLTIGGDSSSDKSCFKANMSANDKDSNNSPTTVKAGLSQAAIIGISVGAGIIGLVAILMLFFVLRERRRRRRASATSFDPSLLNQKWPPEDHEKRLHFDQPAPMAAPPPVTPNGYFQEAPNGFVRDPPYTNEKYASSVMSDVRTSMGSWNQFVPEDQRNDPALNTQGRRPSVGSSRVSMDTVDIENILQMATVAQLTPSGTNTTRQVEPTPSTAGTAMTTFDVAKPAIARLVSTRRSRNSDPPDMPTPASKNPSYAAPESQFVPSSYTTYRGDSEPPSPNGTFRLNRVADGGIGGFPVASSRGAGNPRDSGESWVVR